MQRKLAIIVALLCVTVGLVWAADEKPAEPAAGGQATGKVAAAGQTLEQKVSYGIGLNIGNQLKQDDLNLDVKLLSEGIADALSGAEPKINPQELQAAMMEFQQQMQAKMTAKAAAAGEENKVAGEKFLAENKKAEGVKITDSGLQYQVLNAGDGPMPKATDKVKTHYRGTLLDGTVFDSSYDRGEPVTFPVNGVIAGWTEALQLMKVGSKWKLFIPSELAYGERGAGQMIGPNQTLVFEVELLGIEN
jgi:FKBP-type peptidyl-prolyl cis-trans isomerase FklB